LGSVIRFKAKILGLKSTFYFTTWAVLRRSEVQNLDIRDIDFNRKRITLTGKGDKTRVVPIISDEFLSELWFEPPQGLSAQDLLFSQYFQECFER
jgi:site-specific recombinase XerC